MFIEKEVSYFRIETGSADRTFDKFDDGSFGRFFIWVGVDKETSVFNFSLIALSPARV